MDNLAENYIDYGGSGKLIFNPHNIEIKDGKAYVSIETQTYNSFIQWKHAVTYKEKKKSNEISIAETVKDIRILET